MLLSPNLVLTSTYIFQHELFDGDKQVVRFVVGSRKGAEKVCEVEKTFLQPLEKENPGKRLGLALLKLKQKVNLPKFCKLV